MTVLPQYQGDLYTLQTKQALAQALMQQSMQPQQIQATGSGPYTVMPKYSIGGGLAQLGQALLGAKLQQQASQGLQGLGSAQWSMLAGNPSSGVGGTSDGTQQTGTVANPFQSDPQALAGALGASGSAAPQQASGGGMLAPGSALNPSGMDPGKAAYLYLSMGPTEYAKNFVAPYVKPTDATLMARQAGVDPAQANAGALLKANNLPMNTYAPNTILQDPRTGQMSATPSAAPEGSQIVLTPNGPQVAPIPGALPAIQGAAAAQAAGSAQFKPVQVYDPTSKQMVYSNEAAVTNPSAPAPVRNNNPGAMMPGGKLATYPDMQTGLMALDNNLQSYGKQGVNTISGVISKWAPPNENDTQAYIKDVSQRLGVKPDQKIDLTNPLVRQSLSTAIALHENGPSGVFGSSSGAPAAAPPLGAQANVEAQVKGQVDTMQKSYQNLQTVRSGAPAALQDVDNMSKLAQGANPLTIGPAGAKFAGLFSANAAEYEKSRDNLVTNLGSQLGINSDAARDLVYGSIPSYGAPKQAVQNGLQTLRGQIQTRLLKSDYLSDAYATGDAKAYNQRENQFDQHITPAIANVVAMPSGPERAAALKQAAQNPQMRARLEWAAQNGVLK
jgi:hypothetical protein